MRCEECRAVVEEYFDGELERRQGERVGAHLAACADCAAAHDALAFEQETFLRYDRGLEVTPALWENVRASVARLEVAEPKPERVPPFAALRRRLAGGFGALARRAAFAPALALVLVAALAGALWLARKPATETPREVAADAPAVRETAKPAAPPQVSPPANVGLVNDGEEDHGVRTVNAGGARPDTQRRTRRPAGGTVLTTPAPEYLSAAEAEQLLAGSPAPPETDDAVAAASMRLPTPEEKEMSRHLEQARTLLRSFGNEVEAGGDAVQIAYERRLSRRLLEENATLQLEAEVSGDKGTKQVLDSLEPFLLDIANLRDNASRDEVRSIRERMQKKEIIAALHVY